MASVKARRPRGGRGRAAGPPPSVPKLAYMKLEGAQRVAESFEALKSPRKMGLALAGAVLTMGAAVAGAVWIGGSLLDTRETLAEVGDVVAARAGFALKAPVEVYGVSGARAEEVRAAAIPAGRLSLFSAAPEAVRARVEKLDWVEDARVQRLWPHTVRIKIKRRDAYALWKNNRSTLVIDAAGRPIDHARWNDFAGLPVVSGDDAGPAARPILAALENAPAVRARLHSARRISGRRWDLKLKSGAIIALPEKGAAEALATVDSLQGRYRLLDRPIARIDLRTPGRLVVAPRGLAGGPGLADYSAPAGA